MSNLEKLMYIFFLYMHGVENLRLYEVSHTGPGETKVRPEMLQNVAI